ncbi:hypothetical protein N325_02644, partial [Colius striatus]
IAGALWRKLVSESEKAEEVLQELLGVLEDMPLHRTSTSKGDSIEINPMAATRALQAILQMPDYPPSLWENFPAFFLALLFQSFFLADKLP